ncbi:LysR family transcriptional regulator [Sphingomonas sp. LR61]
MSRLMNFAGVEAVARLEQRAELLDDVVDGVVERPRRVRVHGRRDLDRHVVDVVARQELVRALEPACGLALAQHGLAEQVHVEPDAVPLDLGDGGPELRVGRVDDEVADHAPEHPAGDGHDDGRQGRGHAATEAHESAHRCGQEPGGCRCDLPELAGGDGQVFRADDAVHEADREVQTGGVGEHPGELLGGAVDRERLGLGQPLSDECDGLVRQGVVVGGGVLVQGRHGFSVERPTHQRKQRFVMGTRKFRYREHVLDVRRLVLLRELSIRGTIAAVAEAVNFTPSAVSQQLSTLEREAGVPLLRKAGRRLQLTPQAEVLVQAAGHVLDVLELAQSQVEETMPTVQGRIRVAVFQSAALALMPNALHAMATEHPDVRIEMVQREPETALHETWARDFDVVIAEQYPRARGSAPSRARPVGPDHRRGPARTAPGGHRARTGVVDRGRRRAALGDGAPRDRLAALRRAGLPALGLRAGRPLRDRRPADADPARGVRERRQPDARPHVDGSDDDVPTGRAARAPAPDHLHGGPVGRVVLPCGPRTPPRPGARGRSGR